MKKVLLASAALLVAGMVSANAAPVKLSVGGYANWYTGFVDGNNAYNKAMTYTGELELPVPAVKEYNHVPVVGDVEIDFKGETVLENGVKIGAVIELSGVTGGYNAVNEDQSYVYVDSAYGRFAAGKMDTLSKQFHTASLDVGLFGVQDSDVQMLISSGVVDNLATDIRDMDNATTLAYVSPKFAGFTLGVQYSAMTIDATNNDGGDGAAYAATVAYDNTFGSVKLSADLSYAKFDIGANDFGYDPSISSATSLGVRVAVNGLTFGAGYKYEEGDATGGDVNTFDVGVAYETGPYGVSLSYIHEEESDDEILVNSHHKRELLLGSVYYNVTCGVDTFASVAYTRQSYNYDSSRQNAYVLATGLGLTF